MAAKNKEFEHTTNGLPRPRQLVDPLSLCGRCLPWDSGCRNLSSTPVWVGVRESINEIGLPNVSPKVSRRSDVEACPTRIKPKSRDPGTPGVRAGPNPKCVLKSSLRHDVCHECYSEADGQHCRSPGSDDCTTPTNYKPSDSESSASPSDSALSVPSASPSESALP